METRYHMYSLSSASLKAKRFLTRFVFGVIILLTANIALGQSIFDGNESDKPDKDPLTGPPLEWIEGQIVVKFSKNADLSELLSSIPNFNLVSSLENSSILLFETSNILSPGFSPHSLSSLAGVEWVHPNYLINRLHSVQGSYPFGDLLRVGSINDQDAVEMLDLPTAHDLATGSGTVVAVIDGGIDIYHPGLDGSAVFGYDFVDDDETPFDEPDGFASGHGTFVAGLIHLTAPDAQIKAYRVINETGYGDGFSLAQAIERAVDDGCQVINISLVLMHQHLAVTEAIGYANSMGVTVVCAAGNEATAELIYPAADLYAIGVAAIDSQMSVADFSNFGSYIDVCAPATRAYSTYQDDGYAWWSGTSFAAPFVSGQAALLLEQSPLSTPLDLLNGISISCSDLDILNPGYVGNLGAGLIKPFEALSMSGETAMLSHDTLYYEHYEGAIFIVMPGGQTILSSTNTPAFYTAEILGESLPFSIWIDSVGYTDDTLWIVIDPWLTPEGDYSVTVRFTVEGVYLPVDLTILLTVNPNTSGSDYALLIPNTLFFEAALGTEVVLSGGAVLWSTNAPANYSAEVISSGGFTNLLDPTGQTNDSVKITVNPSVLPSAGTYVDTIVYFVEGIESPAVMYVNLQITDPGLSTDTGWVWPKIQTHVTSPGVDEIQNGMIYVGSSGEQLSYTLSVLGQNEVVSLSPLTVLNMTNDSLFFTIQSGYDREPGLYSDTLMISVDGITNSPLFAVVNLYVDSTSAAGTASAWPYAQYFEVAESTPFDLSGAIFVNYTAGIAAYTAAVVVGENLVELNQSSGMTGDSIYFTVSHDVGLDSGIYIDTIKFDVEGASNSPVSAIVYVAVGGAGSGYGVPTVSPSALAFYGPAGQSFQRPSSVYLAVTKEPHDFFVSVGGVNDFTFLIDSIGVSDDSINFIVSSNSGLPAGVYIDSLRIDIPNASPSTKWVLLLLEIADSSGTGDDSCCTMAGDLNGNGIDMEWADTIPLSQALSTGSLGYIDCLATADLNHDCIIDIADLGLLKLLIMGDSLPYPDCGSCESYTFVTLPDPYLSCCIEVGDVDMNGVAFEAADTLKLGEILQGLWEIDSVPHNTMEMAPCLGSADINQNCIVDLNDLNMMRAIMLGDSTIPAECGSCTEYTVILDTSSTGGGSDTAWVDPPEITLNVPYGTLDLYSAMIKVYSSNAPADFVAWVLDDPDVDPNSFVVITDSLGTTADSILIGMSVESMPPGTHVDTIVFDVFGTNGSVFSVVTVNVGADSSSSNNLDELSLANHPNPFNPNTTISFTITETALAELSIFNVLGQRVITLIEHNLPAGDHQIEWNGMNENGQRVASGLYLYRLKAGDISMTKKMMMLK